MFPALAVAVAAPRRPSAATADATGTSPDDPLAGHPLAAELRAGPDRGFTAEVRRLVLVRGAATAAGATGAWATGRLTGRGVGRAPGPGRAHRHAARPDRVGGPTQPARPGHRSRVVRRSSPWCRPPGSNRVLRLPRTAGLAAVLGGGEWRWSRGWCGRSRRLSPWRADRARRSRRPTWSRFRPTTPHRPRSRQRGTRSAHPDHRASRYESARELHIPGRIDLADPCATRAPEDVDSRGGRARGARPRFSPRCDDRGNREHPRAARWGGCCS